MVSLVDGDDVAGSVRLDEPHEEAKTNIARAAVAKRNDAGRRMSS